MSERPAGVSIEALLAHRDFVRGLVRALVSDPHHADDVTQDTWLAALENPPRDASALRSWLARVARRLAARFRRDERRRRRREEASARPEALPSTAEAVERETLRRRVVDAVLALDEPYRSTLILR